MEVNFFDIFTLIALIWAVVSGWRSGFVSQLLGLVGIILGIVLSSARMLKKLQPEDLLKFGLIPEFIGRIPVYAVLDALDEDTLKMILTEPKNAVIKQYACLLDMDGVKLNVEPEALTLIAQKAIKRKTGARALKSIVEEIMLDVMYNIPSDSSIKEFTITKDMINLEEHNEKKDSTFGFSTNVELLKMPQKNQAESA